MDNTSLLHARESWYEAFFSGNTQFMEEIEVDSFVVVNEHGVQTKREQLQGITAASNARQWFPAGTKKQDVSVNVQQHGDLSVVSGKGFTLISGDQMEAPVFFSEVWCKASGAWQVLHLHYTSAKNG